MSDLTVPVAVTPVQPAIAAAAERQDRVRRPSLWRDEGYTRSAIQRPLGD